MADIVPDRSTTATLTPGQSVESAIDFARDTDLIRVELSAGQIYAFDMFGAASGRTLGDPVLTLMDSNLQTVAFDDDSGLDLDARIALVAPTSGIYYLEAASFEELVGTYRLSMTAISDDWGQSMGGAGQLVAGAGKSGMIDFIGDRDWFSVDLNAGVTYSFFMRGAAESNGTLRDPYLTLFDSTGTSLAASDDGVGDTLDSLLSFTPSASGTYSLEASAFDNRIGSYSISAAVITDGSGSNLVDGGSGDDTLELAGPRASYSVLQANGFTYFVGAGDADRAADVEQVQFADTGAVSLADVVATSKPFDGLAYIASYGDLRAAYGSDAAAGTNHFASWGFGEGRTVSFDPLAYIASYADLRAAFGSDAAAGAVHYIRSGANEGRTVSFDPKAYLASYADLRAAYGTDTVAAAQHYINWGADEGRTVTFNALDYIASYGDLIDAFGTDTDAATTHFIDHGTREGRTVTFNALDYIASYGDLIDAFGTDTDAATTHFIDHGTREGRTVTFKALNYIASYGDLIDAFGTDTDAATTHFIAHGAAEGRSVTFDPLLYGAGYVELARAFGDDPAALATHYILYGSEQGLSPNAGFDAVGYLLGNPDLGAARLGADGALHHWLAFGASDGFHTGDALFGREQTSHALAPGGSTDAAFEFAGDHDWFEVAASAGQRIEIDYHSTVLDAALELHRSDGSLVAATISAASGHDQTLSFTADASDTYYFALGASNASMTAGYSLDLVLL